MDTKHNGSRRGRESAGGKLILFPTQASLRRAFAPPPNLICFATIPALRAAWAAKPLSKIIPFPELGWEPDPSGTA